MAISQTDKVKLIKKFGTSEKDTGKTEVQLAILTSEINNLTTHMIQNKKDNLSKRGLHKKVSHRKSLLNYLKNKDIERYRKILKELNLRGS